jgi:ERF superfamily protein
METNTLYSALAAAQGEFTPIKRDKTVKVSMKAGGSYTFSYAPLESILHATLPALSKHGLSLTQATVVVDGKESVETLLFFTDGTCIRNLIPIFVRDDGPQAYGSALTYARRYGVTLLLCVSADDDDDGNAAEGNQAALQPKTLTPVQSFGKRLVEALALGMDDATMEIWNEGVKNKPIGEQAWELLTASERSAVRDLLARDAAKKTPKSSKKKSTPQREEEAGGPDNEGTDFDDDIPF